MPSDLHQHQNVQAARWLKKQGFPIVAMDVRCIYSREIPDVIGFRSTCSVVIESKVSRADFFADRDKPERQSGIEGLGLYRFYIVPDGLVGPDETPTGWGLLYSDGKKVIREIKPKGNGWHDASDSAPDDWREYQHPQNVTAERSILFTLCRRLAKGESVLF